MKKLIQIMTIAMLALLVLSACAPQKQAVQETKTTPTPSAPVAQVTDADAGLNTESGKISSDISSINIADDDFKDISSDLDSDLNDVDALLK